MAQVTIRNLDDEVLAAHRRQAAAHGRSLSDELREVSIDSAGKFHREPEPSPEELIAEARRIRAMQLRPARVSSVQLLRESRDERDARIEAAMRGSGRRKKTGK